jgi:hypothetical protein
VSLQIYPVNLEHPVFKKLKNFDRIYMIYKNRKPFSGSRPQATANHHVNPATSYPKKPPSMLTRFLAIPLCSSVPGEDI